MDDINNPTANHSTRQNRWKVAGSALLLLGSLVVVMGFLASNARHRRLPSPLS
jgi:hypothetical protein